MAAAPKLTPPLTWRRADVLTSSVTVNLLTLAMPFVILQVYDRILPNVAWSTLAFLIGGLVAVTVADVLIRICRAAILSAAGGRFEHQSGLEAFNNVLKSDITSYEARPAAHYTEGFKALGQVREFHAGQTAELMADLPFAILFLFLIWIIGGSLVVVPLVVLGLFAALTLFASRNLKAALEGRTMNDERRTNFLMETLEGVHTLKAMAMEKSMLRRYERLEYQSAVAVRDLTKVHGISLASGYFFSQLAVVATVVIGATYVVGSNLTMGGLAACTMLTGRSLRPVLKGMSFWNNYQSQVIAHDKAETLFRIEPEPSIERPCREGIKGGVSLVNVTVAYEDAKAPLLENISLDIKPGEMIGIVGGTGCGKSSLLRLMNGTLSPHAGTVLIDDKPIHHFIPQQLRRQIAFMPDAGTMFEGTILDNVAMFRTGEPRKHAIEVMRFLGLEDYISGLPEGLDTRLSGTRADRVPGGIKQRLVLARALVDAPEILLFDNANVGLDSTSDAKLLKTFTEMKGERTIILACMRPSYLRLCDRLFELKDGHLTPWELPKYVPPPSVQIKVQTPDLSAGTGKEATS